jgi:hypothetical protein
MGRAVSIDSPRSNDYVRALPEGLPNSPPKMCTKPTFGGLRVKSTSPSDGFVCSVYFAE